MESLKFGQQVLEQTLEEFREVARSSKDLKWLCRTGILEKRTATFAELEKDVGAAVSTLASRPRGIGKRIAENFRKFCGKLDSYSNLFSLIPQSSQYCSLFCGTIKIIVMVCQVLF